MSDRPLSNRMRGALACWSYATTILSPDPRELKIDETKGDLGPVPLSFISRMPPKAANSLADQAKPASDDKTRPR